MKYINISKKKGAAVPNMQPTKPAKNKKGKCKK